MWPPAVFLCDVEKVFHSILQAHWILFFYLFLWKKYFYFSFCIRPNSYVEVMLHGIKLQWEKLLKSDLNVTLIWYMNPIKFNAKFIEYFGWLYRIIRWKFGFNSYIELRSQRIKLKWTYMINSYHQKTFIILKSNVMPKSNFKTLQ